MQVHGIDAHVGVTLEDQLVVPVWHRGVQAPDFIVVPEVKNMSLSCMGVKENKRELIKETFRYTSKT